MKHKKSDAKIEVTKDGPYLVSGNPPLSEQSIVTNAEGESLDYREEKKYPTQKQDALCRCGQSASHQPYPTRLEKQPIQLLVFPIYQGVRCWSRRAM
jgi:CDGSH-type Zn-finger protein